MQHPQLKGGVGDAELDSTSWLRGFTSLNDGPNFLDAPRPLRASHGQTDRAQDRILHRAGVLSGLSYLQDVANASCPPGCAAVEPDA
jgi:hypothetical protein